MRLGNAAWGLRNTPLERQLQITADMGLNLLELSIAGYERDFLQLDATTQQLNRVRQLFQNHDVSLECACTGNDFTGDDWRQQLDKVQRVLDIAGDLGVSFLRIFAGFSSDSQVLGKTYDTMLHCLAETAQYAAERNVTPVVETHGGVTSNGHAVIHVNSVTTRADTWRDILKTGVNINFDPANLAAAGWLHPQDFYRNFKDHIPYVHLKDFRDVPGGVLPAACGDPGGRLDWPKLMETLKDFNGPALIEYEVTEDVEDGLRRSLRCLRSFS